MRLLAGGLLVALAFVFTVTVAVSENPAKPDQRALEEKVLRDMDTEWSKAASALDLDRTVSYYAEDASLLQPNAPIATGKEALRREWAKLLDGFSGGWQPTKIDVSRGNDMAYIIGTYDVTWTHPGSKTLHDRGKYVEVCKKQSDGKWKVVVDIFNSDLPLSNVAQ
jgi:ketosteroid isomerase-like protein